MIKYEEKIKRWKLLRLAVVWMREIGFGLGQVEISVCNKEVGMIRCKSPFFVGMFPDVGKL